MDTDVLLTVREQKLRYGKIWSTIIYFCAPTVLLMLIQGVYNILDKTLALTFATPNLVHDKFFIDEYNKLNPGANVTEVPWNKMRQFINIATQYASQTYNLQFSFAVMVGMGCAMNFSIAYGQRNHRKMKEIAGNGFSITILSSIVIALIVFSLVYPGWKAVFITSQMGDKYNPITQRLAWDYSYLMLWGAPFMFLSYYFMSLIRSEGKMGWVTAMVLSSMVVNVIASITFMKLGMGLEGAMLGTVIAWIFQVIWGLYICLIDKNSFTKFGWKDIFHIRWSNFTSFMAAGFPSLIINLALVITSYITTMIVVKLPDQEIIDNVSILQQLYSSLAPWMAIILSAGIGLTQGARSIIAYNYGAKKYNRIWQVLRRVSVLMFIWFSLMLVVIIAFAEKMMITFAFPTEYASKYRWFAVLNFMTYPLCAATYIALILFQGINKSLLGTFTSSLRTFVVAVPLTVLGYFVSLWAGNSIYFFVFTGLTDLVSALIIMPILYDYWRKYRLKLIDVPDNFDNRKYVGPDSKIKVDKNYQVVGPSEEEK